MKDYKEMAWLIERIIHKYVQFEKKPQRYLKDLMLTQTEIHTVTIVGDYPGINVTGLAKMRGITKGAASQMVYKLVDKGLIRKETSPDSDAAVSLFLTEHGEKARDEHGKIHESKGARFAAVLSDMPDDLSKRMIEFLKAFEAELDN